MRSWAWPAFGIFVAACFWGFWWYGPFDLDEGLYSVALMEMQARGDWVVPTYRGEPFFEKPIFVFWGAWIADLCGASGVTALRLPGVLATLCTLALVTLFSRRLGAAMILSVSLLFMGIGRMFIPDPFLVLGMTAALLAFWKSREDPRWQLAAGAALALAVLSKGPMPVVVFGLLGLYWRIFGLGPSVRGGVWRVLGVLLFLALVLPWYVSAALRSPEFVQEFLIKQNLGRLAGGDVVHLGPFWMYVPVIFAGLFPFSLSLVGAWRKREKGFEQYLWAYVWILFVMFSLSGTKLPHYILPIFPALALLLDRHLEKPGRRVRWEYAAAVGVVAIGLWLYPFFAPVDGALEEVLRIAAFAATLGSLTAGVVSLFERSAVAQGMSAMAPLTLTVLLVGPLAYWSGTHRDAKNAALLAGSLEMPVVEYRMGGERERGKTSHPSMQWWMRQNSEVATRIAEIERRASERPIALISRDGRFESDFDAESASMTIERTETFGAFSVYVISSSE